MLESEFKKNFMSKLYKRLNGVDLDVYTTNNRSKPDYVLLGNRVWVALEFKRSAKAGRRPNQRFHVERMNNKSYAFFVYPENEEEILDAVENIFQS